MKLLHTINVLLALAVSFASIGCGTSSGASLDGKWGEPGDVMTLSDGNFRIDFRGIGPSEGTYRVSGGNIKFFYSRLMGFPKNPDKTWDDCSYTTDDRTLSLTCENSAGETHSFTYTRMSR